MYLKIDLIIIINFIISIKINTKYNKTPLYIILNKQLITNLYNLFTLKNHIYKINTCIYKINTCKNYLNTRINKINILL